MAQMGDKSKTPKKLSPYAPQDHFVEVEKLPPVIQGPIDDDTELWLIRFPANELNQADLKSKRVKLKLDALEGKIGHFANEKGQEYNIIKHGDAEVLQPYAIIPTGNGPFKVRKITSQLGCVKAWNLVAKKARGGGSTIESEKDASSSRVDQETDVSSRRQPEIDSATPKKRHKSKRRKSE